ncbi:MAG: NmrA/HSCARG family protein [Calditrichia bacterium]
MAEKKIIAVTGATGSQGGGLVQAIIKDRSNGFTARALTRDINSDKAKKLADSGVEVVFADVNDTDSIKAAFEGAYGAYCVTFFWEHFSPEKEMQHAANLANAAKEAQVKHVIWSTLEDTRKWVPLGDDRMPTLMGKFKVPHYDAKGEANKFFTEQHLPVTFLYTSFYWDNFIYFGLGPKRGSDGKLVLTLPMADKRLPGIAAEDIGKCAYGIFKRGEEFIGKSVGIAGGKLSGSQMAEGLSKTLGEEVQYNAVDPAVFRGFGFPGAEDLGNMFQFKQEFEKEYCGSRSIEMSRSLNPSLLTFDEWLGKYGRKIPLE